MDGDGFIILPFVVFILKKKKWYNPDSTGIVADDLFLQQNAKNRIIGCIKKKNLTGDRMWNQTSSSTDGGKSLHLV